MWCPQSGWRASYTCIIFQQVWQWQEGSHKLLADQSVACHKQAFHFDKMYMNSGKREIGGNEASGFQAEWFCVDHVFKVCICSRLEKQKGGVIRITCQLSAGIWMWTLISFNIKWCTFLLMFHNPHVVSRSLYHIVRLNTSKFIQIQQMMSKSLKLDLVYTMETHRVIIWLMDWWDVYHVIALWATIGKIT